MKICAQKPGLQLSLVNLHHPLPLGTVLHVPPLVLGFEDCGRINVGLNTESF